jgi:hypothetical protein
MEFLLQIIADNLNKGNYSEQENEYEEALELENDEFVVCEQNENLLSVLHFH